MHKVISRNEVVKRCGFTRSTIYLYISQKNFPAPIRLGKRKVGWIEEEVNKWIEDRIKERDKVRNRDVEREVKRLNRD